LNSFSLDPFSFLAPPILVVFFFFYFVPHADIHPPTPLGPPRTAGQKSKFTSPLHSPNAVFESRPGLLRSLATGSVPDVFFCVFCPAFLFCSFFFLVVFYPVFSQSSVRSFPPPSQQPLLSGKPVFLVFFSWFFRSDF